MENHRVYKMGGGGRGPKRGSMCSRYGAALVHVRSQAGRGQGGRMHPSAERVIYACVRASWEIPCHPNRFPLPVLPVPQNHQQQYSLVLTLTIFSSSTSCWQSFIYATEISHGPQFEYRTLRPGSKATGMPAIVSGRGSTRVRHPTYVHSGSKQEAVPGKERGHAFALRCSCL